jgi:FixJ family two-component response regulator
MASAATLGTLGRNPTAASHIFRPNSLSKPPSNGTPIVFLIGDDISDQESLKSLVGCQGWQLETFESEAEFLARPRPLVPSCLILDISLTDPSGLELQKRMAKERIETPIIFITSDGDVRTTVQAIKAGAVEFLIKPYKNDALSGAIREGLERSRVALHREMEIRELQNCYASLTRRERQVMALIVSGLLNKQVGGELGISEITVKAHRGQVMQKMKADSFAKLVIMATRLRPARFANTSSLLQEPVHSEVVS